ncbi:hypothetical protein FH972_017846 [Carpinus fangiana]|uniref:Uncharacterized protein n=1 Tax=Carpinus fangiana TaxID=176857 RepID=A0A5N6RK47_9ROSI|nr:hypothetical protein FH972_017846 [Carpinus fangiana]
MNEDMDPVMRADFQEGKSTHSCCIKGKEISGGGVLAVGQSNHGNIGVGEGFSAALEEIAAGNVNGKEPVLEADFQEGKTSHSRSIKLSKILEIGVLAVDKSPHENMEVGEGCTESAHKQADVEKNGTWGV